MKKGDISEKYQITILKALECVADNLRELKHKKWNIISQFNQEVSKLILGSFQE